MQECCKYLLKQMKLLAEFILRSVDGSRNRFFALLCQFTLQKAYRFLVQRYRNLFTLH